LFTCSAESEREEDATRKDLGLAFWGAAFLGPEAFHQLKAASAGQHPKPQKGLSIGPGIP
jgi:hypothetical protein